METFELGPIRPPSEAHSLLIRVTRNCPWNRCQFCTTYKGQKFELRPVQDVKRDILTARSVQDRLTKLAVESGGRLSDTIVQAYESSYDAAVRNVSNWMYTGGDSAFLQDANSLILSTKDLTDIIRFLKQTLPSINRVTTYARSHTVARRSPEELTALREAGLSRIHIGMESGSDAVLKLMDKGVTAADQVVAGRKVVASGISLCEYVLLGLGGVRLWHEHALETACVLNQINPDFIRIRTLSISEENPLRHKIASGDFVRLTDEQIIDEEKLLIQNLTCRSSIISDHITDLLQEIEGRLPEDKPQLLGIIEHFQSLAPEERLNFMIGRRMGVYGRLDDLDHPVRRESVGRAMNRMRQAGQEPNQELVYALMERFV